MPKYLVQASYVGDGVQGLRQEGGSARRVAVEAACASVGGRLDAFYFAFGETDAYVVLDVPDNKTAAAASLAVKASGAATSEVIVLLTPEEIDEAAKISVDYRPPGS